MGYSGICRKKKEADKHGMEPAKLTVDESVALILSLTATSPATIIIDALDECQPGRRFDLLSALGRVMKESANLVKIFVSSRDDTDIVIGLKGFPNIFINADDNSGDIIDFIDSELERTILNSLVSGAGGMYNILRSYATLYFPLHYEIIEQDPNLTGPRRKLKKFCFPYDVNSSYRRWVTIGERQKVSLEVGTPLSEKLEQALDPSTPLFLGCCFGLSSILEELSELKGFYGNLNINWLQSSLSCAAEYGYYKIVQHLLESGIDFAQPGLYGPHESIGAALQMASSAGHENVIRLLLEKGADVNQTVNVNEPRPSYSELPGFYQGLWRRLYDRSLALHYRIALQVASFAGHENVIRLLLDHGADVNQSGPHGTALQAASSRGNSNMAQLLLNHGADVNQFGPHGAALRIASSRGHEIVVRLLLRHGADVVQTGPCSTALKEASSKGHRNVVRLLLNHDADVN
ncbi:MAG: hypothetical protein M1819_006953 [Sarea resinae]|nr:MAG: hypothetical protein M1819_006953 [Sarea resinae]